MIWREKRLLLTFLGVLLAANTLFFFTYRVQYQSRLDDLDSRLRQAEGQLDRAQSERVSAEKTLQGYKQVEHDVEQVFTEQWSTQPARLTRMIGEVKRLAIASGLQPQSYSFQRASAVSEDRARRNTDLGVTAVGVRFSVAGNYEQVRRLLNLLELSDQFVIVDEIALASVDGSQLTLNLHLTTLFRDQAPARAGSERL